MDQDQEIKDQEPKDQELKDQELKDQELKDQELKEEQKAVESRPKTIKVIDAETGEEYDFTAEQVVELAQYGLAEHSKKKKINEPKQEELNIDDKVNKLEQQIVNMETRTKNEKQGQLVLNILNKSAEKFDLTKNGGPLTDKIKMMTLLRLNQNPRLDPAVLFAEETKSYMEILEKMNGKQIANDKVRGALTGTLRGGSIPAIDTSKKFTVKDLKGSGSREAMRLFLESQE